MKKIYPLGNKIDQLISETSDDFVDVPYEDDKEYKTQAPLSGLPKGGYGYSNAFDEDTVVHPVILKKKPKKRFIDEFPPKENYNEEPEVKFENKRLKEQKNPKKEIEQIPTQSPSVPGPYSQDVNVGQIDPNQNGGVDPNTGINNVGMDGAGDPNASGGMYQDPNAGLGGMPPAKTATEIGRIFELKKIYSRLISIEEYLSFSPNVTLVNLRDYVSKSIQLFEILISNVDSFQDQMDEIIVMFYKFLEYVYEVLNKFYKDKTKDDKSNVDKTKLFTSPAVSFRKK